MRIKRSLVCWALLFLSACGSSDPGTISPTQMQPGDYKQTITVGTDLRSYILHVPANYDGSKALPLVFVLHGHGGTAGGMVNITGMNDKADQTGFFVAYLQATIGSDGVPDWNSGNSPAAYNSTADDVAFVRDLSNQLEGQLNVDSKRIYATGLSMGDAMSCRVATELPALLAGVAPVAGSIGNSDDGGTTFSMIPDSKGSIPILIIHGKSDTHVLYDGGQGVIPELWVTSVAEAVAFWTQADACTGTPQTQTSTDGHVSTDDYAVCAPGSEVELITILSGQHEWPTLSNHSHFAGTEAIWEFFSRHSKADQAQENL